MEKCLIEFRPQYFLKIKNRNASVSRLADVLDLDTGALFNLLLGTNITQQSWRSISLCKMPERLSPYRSHPAPSSWGAPSTLFKLPFILRLAAHCATLTVFQTHSKLHGVTWIQEAWLQLELCCVQKAQWKRQLNESLRTRTSPASFLSVGEESYKRKDVSSECF